MKRKAPRLVIAAPASGSGKTLLTCGLLSALVQSGIKTAAFKCGPDYIDPMFHETVLGTPSKNLDTFFTDEEMTRQLFLEDAVRAEISVVEGVMGFYDGLGGISDQASTWNVAKAIQAPVIFVADASRSSLSVLAMIRGFMEFRKDSMIRGVIFNRMSPGRYPAIKKLTEESLGIRVCGYIPRLPEFHLESRHLGLVMPGELQDLKKQMARLGQQCRTTLDLSLLKNIAGSAPDLEEKKIDFNIQRQEYVSKPVIAVAKDEAFSFYYKDNLRLLEKMGARLLPFSPLHDREVPEEADALLLGGGYPELYADALAGNCSMRRSVREHLLQGMPCMAECGGFLYLLQKLEDQEGSVYPMVGLYPGKSRYTGRLTRFGYVTVTARKGDALLKREERIRAHEFHYMDTDGNGKDLLAVKPVSERSWECGHLSGVSYAGFPHLYLYSCMGAAGRFTERAYEYGRRKQKNR